MHNRAEDQSSIYSIVIPMHNSAAVLARTIERWREYVQSGTTEIILVENGSTDVTWELAQQVAEDTPHIHFILRQCARGMGNALREGIRASTGDRVLLSADDLPFDFGDVEEAAKLSPAPTVVIGSKAHPESHTDRELHRDLFTFVFRQLRAIVLGSSVGDSQGTIIADGTWLRNVADRLTEPGFLFSTQLVDIAETQGIKVHEVPVTLSKDRVPKVSTVRWHDAWNMGVGLFRIRKSRKTTSRTIAAQAAFRLQNTD
jgi:glycosyltransferase involved in cell wall biosynthesis